MVIVRVAGVASLVRGTMGAVLLAIFVTITRESWPKSDGVTV